jgi:hypothetical protein
MRCAVRDSGSPVVPSFPERTPRHLLQHGKRDRFVGDQQPSTKEPLLAYRRAGDVVARRLMDCRGPLVTPGDEKRRNLVSIGQLGCERKCPLKKENLMASPTMFRSPYDQRLELVRDTIKSHSKLGDKEASELAEHVLQELNSIPEKIR